MPLCGHRRRVLAAVAVELAVDDPAVPAVLLFRGHALEVAVAAGVGADEGGSGAVDERGLAVCFVFRFLVLLERGEEVEEVEVERA